MTDPCSHLDQIVADIEPDSTEGCSECIAIGSGWTHLRMCMICGHVACCDDSPNRHASKHYASSRHPIMRSLEPNEDWLWCFEDEVTMVTG